MTAHTAYKCPMRPEARKTSVGLPSAFSTARLVPAFDNQCSLIDTFESNLSDTPKNLRGFAPACSNAGRWVYFYLRWTLTEKAHLYVTLIISIVCARSGVFVQYKIVPFAQHRILILLTTTELQGCVEHSTQYHHSSPWLATGQWASTIIIIRVIKLN